MSVSATNSVSSLVLATTLLAASLAGCPANADSSRGQGLYENQCQGCHETNVHKRDAHKARNIDEVRGWVASWAAHAELEWTSEEIEDVTRFLSRELYNFEQ